MYLGMYVCMYHIIHVTFPEGCCNACFQPNKMLVCLRKKFGTGRTRTYIHTYIHTYTHIHTYIYSLLTYNMHKLRIQYINICC